MMQWIEKLTRTRTRVHSRTEEMRERTAGHEAALRTSAAVQLGMQLLLWVSFGGYDRAVQTVWQAALMLIIPLAALWLVWRKAAVAGRAGRWILPGLLPCLWLDAALLLYAFTGFVDLLIPEYPWFTGAAAAAAVSVVLLWLAGERGVAYGTSVLKYVLILFFLLGTVFLRASNRADRLWPLMGQGIASTARTALYGAGGTWGAALLFALPASADKPKLRTSFWALIPWLLGAVWALWHGFLRPWNPGDALEAGERLMGLARHAQSVISYELAGLMWLTAIPVALCGGALSGQVILCRAFPKCPGALAGAAVLAPALFLVLQFPARLPQLFTLLLPWRAAVSLLCGAALCLAARREGRR